MPKRKTEYFDKDDSRSSTVLNGLNLQLYRREGGKSDSISCCLNDAEAPSSAYKTPAKKAINSGVPFHHDRTQSSPMVRILTVSRTFDSPSSVRYTFIEPRISTGTVQKSGMMVRKV
jgi:hypothetical protein